MTTMMAVVAAETARLVTRTTRTARKAGRGCLSTTALAFPRLRDRVLWAGIWTMSWQRLVAIPASGLMVALLVACNGIDSNGSKVLPASERSSPEAETAAVESDSLRLGLSVPEQVRAGEPVQITIRVENVSDRSLDLHLRGRTIAFDLIVADEEGDVVWRRLEDAVIPAILRLKTLDVGESLELEDTWDQRLNTGEPVAPGAYAVHGELLTEDEPLVTPSGTLRIVPR